MNTPRNRELERERSIAEDVFNPQESDFQYFLRRKKQLLEGDNQQRKAPMIAQQENIAGSASAPTPRTGTPTIDSSNMFQVVLKQDGIIDSVLFYASLTPEAALNLAAWIVALADPERKRFDRLFQEVKQ